MPLPCRESTQGHPAWASLAPGRMAGSAPSPEGDCQQPPSPRYRRDLVKPIRASLSLTQAIQGKVRYGASQLTDMSAVLKEAAASGKVSLL